MIAPERMIRANRAKTRPRPEVITLISSSAGIPMRTPRKSAPPIKLKIGGTRNRIPRNDIRRRVRPRAGRGSI